MLVSVKRKKFAGTREGRYQPTCSKTFIDTLQMAKREKEELKIKLVVIKYYESAFDTITLIYIP